MGPDLPTLLQHLGERQRGALINYLKSRGDPTLAGLLACSTADLEAAPNVGPKTRAEVKRLLKAQGLRLADPLPPESDPRTLAVTDLWAEIHRATFPGQPVVWGRPWKLEAGRAVAIADTAQGYGRDRLEWSDALPRVEAAFRAYLGDLSATANWPHEPTLEGFSRKLAGRFTGSAPRRATGRAARGEMSTDYSHVEGLDFTTKAKEGTWTA